MADDRRCPNPKVIVTRELPDATMDRLEALFDTRNNRVDAPMSADRLAAAVASLPDPSVVGARPRRRRGAVTALPGDVVDDGHRAELAAAVAAHGGLDLLVNNASVVGPSPLPRLAAHPLPDLLEVFEVNALAPIALVQLVVPALAARGGRIVQRRIAARCRGRSRRMPTA